VGKNYFKPIFLLGVPMDTTAENNTTNVTKNLKIFERVRLQQDFLDDSDVKQILSTVTIRKPNKDEFFRVHSDPNRDFCAGTIKLNNEREVYVVDPGVIPEVKEDVVPKSFLQCINTANVTFLWPLKLPGNDGRALDQWSRSALNAASLAKDKWLKMRSDFTASGYVAFQAKGDLPDPEWPEETFEEILEIAFRDCYIETVDHHIIRKLKGLQV
jgi:hypothetical protein